MKVTFECNSLCDLIDFIGVYIKDKKNQIKYPKPVNKFIGSYTEEKDSYNEITTEYIVRAVKDLLYDDEKSLFDLHVNGVLIKRCINDKELIHFIEIYCKGEKGIITRSATCLPDIFVLYE